GLVVHYPAYRAVGFVATGMAKGAEDALASIKVLAAMLLFPLTWTGVAAAVWLWRGMEAGGVAFALAPLTAYAAPVFFERPEGFLELTLTDVHLGQVVHRPGVALVQHDRFLVRFDRTARVAELALHPAEQAVSLVRRGIDRHDPLDVGKRFLRLALLDQHS